MKNILLTLIIVLAIVVNSKGQKKVETNLPENSLAQVNVPKISLMNLSKPFYNDANKNNNQDTERDVPWFVERFKVSAGFFLALSNTDISISNNSGSMGTDINFERDLGFDKSKGTFLADVQWRSSSRSRFDLSYYGLNRSYDKVIDRTIVVGDQTYNANANINAFFDNSIYRFSYGYALFSKPTWELGVLIGAHIVRANMGIGVNTAAGSVERSTDFDFTAPLPDFGIWGGYAPSERWALNGELGYLDLTINNIRGRILAYNFSATYRVVDKLDITLAYTGFNFKVDAERERLNGNFKWGYNGPTIAAAYSFGRKSWK